MRSGRATLHVMKVGTDVHERAFICAVRRCRRQGSGHAISSGDRRGALDSKAACRDPLPSSTAAKTLASSASNPKESTA